MLLDVGDLTKHKPNKKRKKGENKRTCCAVNRTFRGSVISPGRDRNLISREAVKRN